MPYVTERWLGGMLTNHQTIYKSVQKLEEIEAMMNDGRMENFSKKEQLEFSRKFEKLNTNLGGIRKMKGVPDAVFVVDTAEEETAVREANKLGIPVIGIVDTNCDPDPGRLPDPGQRRRHPRHHPVHPGGGRGHRGGPPDAGRGQGAGRGHGRAQGRGRRRQRHASRARTARSKPPASETAGSRRGARRPASQD